MRIKFILCVAAALVAGLAFSGLGRPQLCLRTTSGDSSVGAIGLLPLTTQGAVEWKQILELARTDPGAVGPLLNEIRTQFSKAGITPSASAPDLFCARCRKGPTLAFHIPEAAYGYFTVVDVAGPMEIELDKKEYGIAISRSAVLPP